MTTQPQHRLVKLLKNKVRRALAAVQLAYVSRFRSYRREGLLASIRALGIVPGDCVIAHCAFDPRHGFQGNLQDFIATLVEAVGPDGTLAMVSMPYSSSTLEYLKRKPRFDVRKTPSTMGLLVETFRKWPGVIRSLSPTHPVLALGRHASHLIEGHEICLYPCGPNSPFDKLLQLNGKALFVNASTFTLTFFHYIEHLVAESAGVPLYDPNPYEIRAVDYRGVETTVRSYVFSELVNRIRRPDVFWRWLDEAGVVRRVRIGASLLASVNLRECRDVVLQHAQQNEYFFDRP